MQTLLPSVIAIGQNILIFALNKGILFVHVSI